MSAIAMRSLDLLQRTAVSCCALPQSVWHVRSLRSTLKRSTFTCVIRRRDLAYLRYCDSFSLLFLNSSYSRLPYYLHYVDNVNSSKSIISDQSMFFVIIIKSSVTSLIVLINIICCKRKLVQWLQRQLRIVNNREIKRRIGKTSAERRMTCEN